MRDTGTGDRYGHGWSELLLVGLWSRGQAATADGILISIGGDRPRSLTVARDEAEVGEQALNAVRPDQAEPH